MWSSGARSIRSTWLARALKSSVMPPSSPKNVDRSDEQVDAGHAAQRPQQRRGAAAQHAHPEARSGARACAARGPPETTSAARAPRGSPARYATAAVSSTSRSKSPSRLELVELGDGGELLRARDRRRQLSGRRGCARSRPPGRGRRRPGRSARRTSAWDRASSPTARPRTPPGRRQASGVDAPRLVFKLLQPERVRQPPGRVDRDDRHAGAARRHPERDRSRCRRLADPAGAAADAHPLALQKLGDAHGRSA